MRLCDRQYNAAFVGYSPENECGRVLGLAAALTFGSFLIEQYQPYQHESQDAPFLGRFVFHQTTSRRSHGLARASARTNGPSALKSWFGRGLLRPSAKRPPKSARGGSKTIVLSRTDSTASWKTHWRTRPGLGRDNAMPLKSCRDSAEKLPGQTVKLRNVGHIDCPFYAEIRGRHRKLLRVDKSSSAEHLRDGTATYTITVLCSHYNGGPPDIAGVQDVPFAEGRGRPGDGLFRTTT